MEMPRPLSPRSPSPKMRLPSVTTMASTSWAGQFQIMADCRSKAIPMLTLMTMSHNVSGDTKNNNGNNNDDVGN